jgi:formylmethanofuran dehydrogenase subunit C
MINLQPAKKFKFPVEAGCINPDVFQSKTIAEIEKLEIWEGNKQRNLGELFKIHEINTNPAQEGTTITIRGDVGKVRRIASQMKNGEVVIHGNAGMHLGEGMKGGRVVVHGNVAGWAGSMMKGGTIEIHGNTGDYLAAPYRGSSEGMQSGRIIIYGNAGNEAGACMEKGTIKIYGNTRQFTGFRMRSGKIYVQKDCEGRTGACMTDGKIIVGGRIDSVLPSFTIDNVKSKVKIEGDEVAEGPFYVFLGDLADNGRGKLYVSKANNPHLNSHEKYL